MPFSTAVHKLWVTEHSKPLIGDGFSYGMTIEHSMASKGQGQGWQ